MALDRRDPLADFSALADEEERRAKEALKVYRPARQLPFHQSHARELVLRGGKRSGKSVGVVAEFASRVLGIPITDPANKPIPLKYQVSTLKDPLLYWTIGWDVDHIGQTIYRLLFQPGLFRVIKDKMTGLWRTYNPADDFDAARFAESQPAGPMIPERFIDTTQGVNGWTWENKGAYNFSAVYLKNGAKICAYPSSAKHAKQGDAVAGIWIDEDIQIPGHLKEWQDRLTDKDGWLMWSVWPHSKNYALCDMLDRADEQVGEENPDIASFQLIMSENPYLHKNAKSRALGRMGSDDEIARRDRGELLLDTLNMYDFYPATHLLSPFPPGETPEKIETVKDYLRLILTRDGTFPKTWTRYIAIDPSHTRTACLFGVVPPPEIDEFKIGDMLIIERELIAQKFSSDMLADALQKLCEGYNFEAFIMDRQIGRQTRVGEDETIFQKYAESFRSHGLRARMCPNSFIPGCAVPPERYRAVRTLLEMKRTGLPTIMFVENKTVITQREFNTYRKKQLFVGGEETIMDEPSNPRKHDAMACHDEITEVLTDDGWKRFGDLSGTETIASVDLDANEIVYDAPTSLYSTFYEGDMVAIGGMKMDALVTPNHRMVVFHRPRIADWDNLSPKIVDAGDLSPYQCVKLSAKWNAAEPDGPFLVPRVYNCMGLEKEIDARLFAEFLGWYVAEGSSESRPVCPGNGYRVNIAQNKLAGIAVLQPLLEQLPWKWTRHKDGFSCSSKQLWSYLHDMGNCYTKRVPEWIKWSDVETIRRFVCGAVAGDGNIQFGKRNYYTSSKGLADDMQELFVKLGVSSSIHVRHPKPGGMIRGRRIVSTVPNYRVLEKIRPIGYLGDRLNKPNFGMQHYAGMVYCASVPHGTMITRRNGKIMVSGNSLEYMSEFLDKLFAAGNAYVNPDMYRSHGGSPAYRKAMQLLKKHAQKESGDYVHLGPGAAA